jgi:hypothetical protein
VEAKSRNQEIFALQTQPKMIRFQTILEQFREQGEKTGWTYIRVPEKLAQQLKPGNKRSFRIKGKIDAHVISGVALLPMGEGDFIMPVNAEMRKAIGKRKGATVRLEFHTDDRPLKINAQFMECLEDEPLALQYFNSLQKSVQNYYSKWIDSAKTEPTKVKRMAMAVSALARKMDFGEMLREQKKIKDSNS